MKIAQNLFSCSALAVTSVRSQGVLDNLLQQLNEANTYLESLEATAQEAIQEFDPTSMLRGKKEKRRKNNGFVGQDNDQDEFETDDDEEDQDDKEPTDEELLDTLLKFYEDNCDDDKLCPIFYSLLRTRVEEQGIPELLRPQIEEAKSYTEMKQAEKKAQEEHDAMVRQLELTGDSDVTIPPLDRELNCENEDCTVPLPLHGIWNYGCWCNFGANLGSGNGSPVNELDEACRKMQLCTKCVRKDHQDCDIETKSYNATFAWSIDQESLVADCKASNPGDECATHICCCELQLISDILDLMWQGIAYDDQYKHSEGWDRVENCNTPGNNSGDGNRECCGQYPGRFLYNSNVQQCCDNKFTYNPLMMDCCDNGELMSPGTCPNNLRKKKRK